MPPIRLIHTADLHFGDNTPHGTKSAELRDLVRQRRYDVFLDMLARARTEKFDAVLIAGDLFNAPNVRPDLAKRVADCMESAGPVPVIVTPGNHDPYTADGTYAITKWPANVKIFTQPRWDLWTTAHSQLATYGWAWTARTGCQWPHPTHFGAGLTPDRKIVIIGHASELTAQPTDWERYAPFLLATHQLDRVAYVALGHLHWWQQLNRPCPPPAVYPGNPQASGFNDEAPKNYAEITIEDGITKVQRIPTNGIEFRKIALHATDYPTEEDLYAAILAIAGPNVNRMALQAQIVGRTVKHSKDRVKTVWEAARAEFAYLSMTDLTFNEIDAHTHLRPSAALHNFLTEIDGLIASETDPPRKAKLLAAREHALAMHVSKAGNPRGIQHG